MKNFDRGIRRVFLVGAAVVATAGLSACTSAGASAPSSESSTAYAQSGEGATASQGESQLPLDAYMSSLTGQSGSYADIAEQNYKQDLKRERLVASCMKRQGFSYTPEATKNTRTTGQVGPSDTDLQSKSWVQKYGYGDVYSPEGVTGALERAEPTTKTPSASDPNYQYTSQLTADEKKAYDKALVGQDGADSTLTVAKDWEKLGCNGAALHTVTNENVIMNSAEGKIVEAAIEQFEDGYASWPGIAQAEGAWASCMTKNGYPGYSKQGEPAAQFAGQNTDLWASVAADAQPATSDLDALAKKERAVALVDLGCRTTTKYTATIRAITIKQENQFMADNKAALDALKSSTSK